MAEAIAPRCVYPKRLERNYRWFLYKAMKTRIPERMMANMEKISSLTDEKSQPAITNQIAEMQVTCRAESLRRGLVIGK